jgi:hypothetical protein
MNVDDCGSKWRVSAKAAQLPGHVFVHVLVGGPFGMSGGVHISPEQARELAAELNDAATLAEDSERPKVSA